MQGDIVAVYDQAGNKLVSYVYDAWGDCYTTNAVSSVPTAVTNNPFKYRGYYYIIVFAVGQLEQEGVNNEIKT